jgi:DNA-binding IscR family transcriptional regulator
LREVVEAVEGPISPNRCLVGSGSCERETQCNVHPVWRKVQGQVVEILDSVTFDELANLKS